MEIGDKEHKQIIADLTNEKDIDKIVEMLPQLDGIVFNAGIIKTVTVKHISNVNIEDVFKTNIISSIQIIQRLLKLKKINKGASIVFISSIATSRARMGNCLLYTSFLEESLSKILLNYFLVQIMTLILIIVIIILELQMLM